MIQLDEDTEMHKSSGQKSRTNIPSEINNQTASVADDSNRINTDNLSGIQDKTELTKEQSCKDNLVKKSIYTASKIFDKQDPLDIMFYSKEYNIHRRAKIILFSSCLLEHEHYKNMTQIKKIDILAQMESACYRYAIEKADEQNIPTEWNSLLFKEIYHAICGKISNNITTTGSIKNTYLPTAIFNGTIDISALPSMSSQYLYPDKYKDLISKLEESKKVAHTIKTSSMYKCRRCHKSECTEENRYNRSLDEGVNLTITCVSCGYRWNA